LFLPLILISVIAVGLVVLKIIMNYKKKEFDIKRSIGVSMVCIVFLFHPTMTLESLNVFRCNQVDEGNYRMTKHMDYECYSADHFSWVVFVGLPILVVWVIVCPLIALAIITKHRHNLEDWKVKKYFLILYQGLKPEKFYWEFFNTFRKFLVLLLNVVLSPYPTSYSLFVVVGK